MRVLHVVTNLGTYGAERFAGSLAERVAALGDEVAVMAIAPSPPGAACAVPLLEVGRRGRYDVSFLPRMIAMMRRYAPDVVHTHMHHGKYWGRLAAVVAGVPAIVHTEHNSEFGAPRAFRPVARALAARTAAFVAFSRTHRAALAADEGIPLERIAVIPNGIALAPPPPGRARARARRARRARRRDRADARRAARVREEPAARDRSARAAAGRRAAGAGRRRRGPRDARRRSRTSAASRSA